MAPKVKTRADFPKGPKGTEAFKNYKLSKLYRTVKGKKVANSVLKIGQKKVLGKALTASAMAENVRLGVKQATIKNKKGDYQGYVGLAQKGVRSLKNTASKRDAEMRAKGFVKNKRGRYVKKKVNKVEKPVNKQKSKINKVDPKQFDSRKTEKVESKKVESKKVESTTKTPKYKQVTQKELDAKIAERKKNKEKLKVKPKKMHAIEKRNRERFGDAHVDKLKKQYAEFKARRKKKKKS